MGGAEGEARRGSSPGDRRFEWLLYAAAAALYAVAISWGEPLARAPGHDMPFGSDELGPIGAVGELRRVILEDAPAYYNPQYPLFGQGLQAVPVGIYLAWLRLTGGLDAPSADYPFGLADPVGSLATLTLLARLPSLLLGAGLALLALRTARELWGSSAGRLAGVGAALIYTLGYYARTSNVDAPALFFTAAGLYVFALCLSRGIDGRRMLAFGVCAALASATKDASYAAFAACGLALFGRALWERREGERALRRALATFGPALAAAVALYVVASGSIFSIARFREHVDWILTTTAAQHHPATVGGALTLTREVGLHLLDTLGTPLLLASIAGLAVVARRRPRDLLLLFPALAVPILTILPVHLANIRFLLIPAYVLVLFSGRASSALLQSRSAALRGVGCVAIALVLGWSLVRAVDLANQMRNDTRVALASWLAANAREGDRVAYWGAMQKLPRVPKDLTYVSADLRCEDGLWRGPEAPAFALVIPQQHFETDHEWTLGEERLAALRDGRLGYELVYRDEGVGWFARRPIPFVNPPVLVFAPSARAAKLAPRLEPPRRRVLAFLEEWVGLTPGPPAGLVPNPARPVPCSS